MRKLPAAQRAETVFLFKSNFHPISAKSVQLTKTETGGETKKPARNQDQQETRTVKFRRARNQRNQDSVNSQNNRDPHIVVHLVRRPPSETLSRLIVHPLGDPAKLLRCELAQIG